ncbi:MAG: insulinase family protein [Bdellovibrionales bacterium]|nr:insulinase family protein [Bdellovibrionales bacterium]
MSTIQKTIFTNGLTLVTERVSGLRGLSMGIWVRVGTRHEQSREAGVSHFLEHMLFKGTTHRTALDIARQVDRLGGEFNAFTTREYTCFHLLLLDRDYRFGLEILEDILLNSVFDAEEIERERKVILQEIAMVDEAPEEIAQDYFLECIYGRHGLGKSILGSESSIRRLSRRDILQFFKKHYSPEQVVFAIAGNISHSKIKNQIRRLGKGKWGGRGSVKTSRRLPWVQMSESGKAKSSRVAARARNSRNRSASAYFPTLRTPPPKFRRGTWWISRETEQAHIVWGVEGPRYDSRDRIAAYLLNTHLGGGMSSALFQEIREKNALAYTVYSSLSPFIDSGVLSIYSATLPARVPHCLKLIEETIERLTREPLTDEQLSEVKDSMKGGILLSDDSVEARMFSIGRSEVFGERHISVEELCEQIDKVTAVDIRRVARKLSSGGRSVLVVGPRPSSVVKKKLRPKFLKR